MRHNSVYRFPELDPMGYNDTGSYLIVNCVGYYEYEEYYKPTHRKNGRKDYYLAYNPHGYMKVRIKDNEYILEPGSIFLYRPSEEQYYGHGDMGSFFSYWVHFTGYGVEELLNQAGLSGISVSKLGMDKKITDLFDQMMAEVQNKLPGYEFAASVLLCSLISLISRKIQMGSSGNAGYTRDEISKSIKYIHDNYSKKIMVRELAGIAHLCKDRYTCLFKKIMHETPQHYILKLKIQKACELMKHTSLGIGQISVMVGFNDQLYFSRIFKRYVNMTPSKYKNLNK